MLLEALKVCPAAWPEKWVELGVKKFYGISGCNLHALHASWQKDKKDKKDKKIKRKKIKDKKVLWDQ